MSAPEPTSSDTASPAGARRAWIGFAAIMTPVAAVFITLGEASDATFLLNEMRHSAIALFSNSVEYEMLEKVHVGITIAYAEELFGNPQVSKTIDEDLTANYFADDKYLLTLFYRGVRVDAYTLVPLVEDFAPEVDMGTNDTVALGEFSFTEARGTPQKSSVDDSRSISFYLESRESGPGGRVIDVYQGSVAYRSGGTASGIPQLYKADVRGDDASIEAARGELRRGGRPNLYGEGELTLRQIEKSLMTNAEFDSYFGDR
jgi:hypothetical protein